MTYLDIYDIGGSGLGDDAKNWISRHPVKFSIITFITALIFAAIILLISWGAGAFTKDVKNQSMSSGEQSNPEQVQPNPEQVQPNPEQVQPNPEQVQPNPEQVQPNPDVEPSNNMNMMDTTGASSGFANMEPFTNDLPYELAGDKLSLNPDMDYNDFLQNMSLDQEVIKQHKQYVTDRNKVTSTASFAPARSDNQDIVTTWGLSKPTYVPIDSSARNVPSQDPEQGSKPVRLQWK
jgi:hypothetical protein